MITITKEYQTVLNINHFPPLFYFKDNVGEHFDPDGTLAARLAQKYSSSDYFHETQEELQKLVSGNRRKMSSIREITYTTSFFHQLKWVSKRSFKNMIGSPEASVAQVTLPIWKHTLSGLYTHLKLL